MRSCLSETNRSSGLKKKYIFKTTDSEKLHFAKFALSKHKKYRYKNIRNI